MANTTIMGLPAAVQAQLTDSLPVDQADGTTRHETLAQIEALLAPMIGSTSTVSGATGATGRGVASVVVNASSQVVVTYSDGTTSVAGTLPAGGAAAIDATLSSTNGTLGVASSLTGSLSTLGGSVAAEQNQLASVAKSYGGDLTAGTVLAPGGVAIGVGKEDTATYKLAHYGGGLNRTGAPNGDDYPAWEKLVAQLLSDAAAYGETRNGFHAIIELEPHVHNWVSGSPTITVPANAAGTGSSLGNITLHITIRYHGSTHYLGGSNGFFMQGYTVGSRVYFQGVARFFAANGTDITACAIGKGATAGVGIAAYFAGIGSGVCNFQSDEILVNDTTYLPGGTPTPTPTSGANAGVLTINAAVDVGGLCLGRISRVTHYGVAAAPTPGSGGCYPGSALIIIRGCNIQVAIYDLVGEYKDDALGLRCYIESLYLYKFGCSNTNRGLHTDTARTDWTSFYPGQSSGNTLFVALIQPDVEADANYSCIDISRAQDVRIQGGNYWQHAEEGGQYNGVAGGSGDVAGNAPIIIRGSNNIVLRDAFIKGPSKDASNAYGGGTASSPGPDTANNVKGVILRQSFYSGLTGGNAPPNGAIGCENIDIADNLFQGFTTNGNLAPIYVDPTDYSGGGNPQSIGKFTTRNNRWEPPPYVDGYVVGSPVQDTNPNNYHDNYSGVGTLGAAPTFTCGKVNAASMAVGQGAAAAVPVDYQRMVFLEAGIPAGTAFNGSPYAISLDTITDPNGNYVSGFWTAPISCWIEMRAKVRLLDTGSSGAPPANTLVGIAWQPNQPGADYDDFQETSSDANVVKFSRLLFVSKGSTWCLAPYASAATAAQGSGQTESRASITFVRLPT